ncbi:E3 ubiquitin-protein ligase TRIM39-like isoform X1 [Carcharodon carcharias]|uniref:E3 ubiquitin-protein ligase TRIM39-like isoform X1 n=1 Tax=Carcharodon carcharias TaxID=13397 RepID=UPI001B7F1E1F|nr:E3 ubiquitin-protein ligase TRIM39-like isoform X1 [Carcharodon carcharias]
MATGQELENLKNESMCSICLDFYREPVTVECEHIFCRACILQHWEAEELRGASCPQCRRQLGQPTFKASRLAASMVASVRGLLEGRRQQEGGGAQCPEHEEKLKLYCEDDQRAICLVCAMSRVHKDHTVRPIKEAAELYKEKLQGEMDSLLKQLEEIQVVMGEDTENLKRLKKRASSVRSRIEVQFDEMQQFLSNEKLALMTKLEEKEKAITQKIEENMKELSDKSSSFNQEITDIQQRLSVQDVDLLLQNPTPIVERSGGESGNACSVSVDLTLEEFCGPLQHIIWNQMFKVLNPAPAALTLDEGMVNRSLCLLNMMMYHSRHYIFNDMLDFEWPSILGPEGFTSGRHYWKVALVNNTSWCLGVAYQSVPGKDNSKQEPATGFWAIMGQLFDGHCEAMSSPPTLLPLKAGLKEVGVYLDYEEGQVSFYNADDMSHLYTFTDTFTEKLHPYLSTSGKKARRGKM